MTKTKKKPESSETISVRVVESYTTWVSRGSIEIKIKDYPELEGMTDKEIQEYVKVNSSDMKPTNDEYCDSLYDELIQQDTIREKITDDNSEIYFD